MRTCPAAAENAQYDLLLNNYLIKFVKVCKKRKVLSKPCGPIGRRLSLFQLHSARHQLMLQDHRYGASASCDVSVYAPAFASTKLCCFVT